MHLVIATNKITKSTTTAHMRLAFVFRDILNADIVSTVEEVESIDIYKYKYFIIVGSAFYLQTAAIEAILRQHTKSIIVWVNNEYNAAPNIEYRDMIYDHYSIIISNVVEKSNKIKKYNEFYLINLNCLFFDTLRRPLQKRYDLLYYGTFRQNRKLYLQQYFQNSDFYISSSKKNLRKFKFLNGCKAIWCDKLNWERGKETLNLFKYSLYVEDTYTHTHYNHLANRFYECLMCNVVMFFDETCLNTIKESGYRIDDKFIVSGYEELKDKIQKYDFYKLFEEQSAWKTQAQREKIQTIAKIKQILGK